MKESIYKKMPIASDNDLKQFAKETISLNSHSDTIICSPFIETESFVHEAALLIGSIFISKGCFIGPYCVIRADEELETVFIGENTNIQDHVLIHASGNYIGSNVNIAHHSIIHGSKIGAHSTIYIRSTLDHAEVGANCFIDAHCYIRGVYIPENTYIPPGTIITEQEQVSNFKQVPVNMKNLHEKVHKMNIEHCRNYFKSQNQSSNRGD